MSDRQLVVAVVGLGYVGLPLAVEFGKTRPTIGLDLSHQKVTAYRRFEDPTGEVSTEELRAATREDLNRLLAHLDDGETRPISPFWRDQDAPKAHGDQ